MSEDKNNQQKSGEIKLTDNIPGAEYANLMQVGHNKEEFRLMFAHVFEPTGKIVSKVTMTPAHFKRMMAAMQENLEKYESQHGKIKDVAASDQKIGFE